MIFSYLMVWCGDDFSSQDPPSLQQQCVEPALALCWWKRVVGSFWATLNPDQGDDFERLFTHSPFTGMLQQPLSLGALSHVPLTWQQNHRLSGITPCWKHRARLEAGLFCPGPTEGIQGGNPTQGHKAPGLTDSIESSLHHRPHTYDMHHIWADTFNRGTEHRIENSSVQQLWLNVCFKIVDSGNYQKFSPPLKLMHILINYFPRWGISITEPNYWLNWNRNTLLYFICCVDALASKNINRKILWLLISKYLRVSYLYYTDSKYERCNHEIITSFYPNRTNKLLNIM